MVSKNDIKWMENYEALKAYILQNGHLPDKHVAENRALLFGALYGVPYWGGEEGSTVPISLNDLSRLLNVWRMGRVCMKGMGL